MTTINCGNFGATRSDSNFVTGICSHTRRKWLCWLDRRSRSCSAKHVRRIDFVAEEFIVVGLEELGGVHAEYVIFGVGVASVFGGILWLELAQLVLDSSLPC